ncbi:ribonuclease H-like domain-containing protein [Tanacetum coccineum]
MAPMASSDSEVKTCSKTCLKNYEALKKQYDDLLVKLSDTGFKAATYKRGLATLEDQIVKYREHEVRFSEEIALLKRSVGSKEYQMGLLRAELEKVKQEKEGFEFKIAKFDKSTKDLEQLLGSQITDKSKKGFGYNAVPSPHPLILNRPTTLDLSYSGLEEFKEPEVNEYGPRDSSLKPTTVCDKKSDNSKENTDDSLEQHQMTDTKTSSFESPLKLDKDWKEKFFYPANHVSEVEPKKVRKNNDALIIEDSVSDDEEEVESPVAVKKKTGIPTAAKIEKPVRKPVKYAEMYISQKPRGNQRNWNNLKSQQLGNEFVMNNKACFACGSFNHLIKDCKRKVQKPIWNNARRVNHHNSHRMSYPHPKRNFVPKAVLMKTGMRPVIAAKPKAAYNVVKRNRFNVVKASACWVWMPKNRVVDNVSKNISASVTLKRLDYIDAQGRFKSVMAWVPLRR